MNGDITVLNEHLYGTTTIPVEDRTTSTHIAAIKPGEPFQKGASGVVANATGGNFAILFLTGDPEDGTDMWLGVAKEESTETSTVDGSVNAYLVGLGTRVRAKATTPANINTVAKTAALVLDNVCLDGIAAATGNTVTTPYTIDEDEGDDPNVHSLQMLRFDIVAGLIEARVVGATNMFGNGI